MTETLTRPGEDLDALADRMRPVADALTRRVHNHSPKAVEALLGPLTLVEVRALAVVLAALRRPSRLLPEDGIVDDIAVERAIAGEQIPLTHRERTAVAAYITAHGGGPGEIAKRLGVSGTTAKSLYEHARRPHATSAHAWPASTRTETRKAPR